MGIRCAVACVVWGRMTNGLAAMTYPYKNMYGT